MRTAFFSILSIALAVSISGCGGGSTRPATHSVYGVLKVDGKPFPEANVVFNPVDSKTGVAALGKTDSEGAYELTTFNTGDGAVAGAYKVTISSVAADGVSDEIDMDNPGEAYGSMMNDGGLQAGANALPQQYASISTTPEQATVKEGSNEFNFDLKR